MHKLLFGLAVVTAAFSASVDTAAAQRAPRPWCFQGGLGSPGGGLPVCAYYSLEQCLGTVGGGAEGCYRNPALEWDRIEGKRRPPARR